MNYDQPRERADTGGWLYTTANRRTGVYAIGYCADHRDTPHETEQLARECYTAYLLDKQLHLDGRISGDVRHRCQAKAGCETYTDRVATVGEWHLYHLCDEHRDRENVAELFGIVGNSVHS